MRCQHIAVYDRQPCRSAHRIQIAYLGNNLELLALTDVLRLGDGGLELTEDLGVKRLYSGKICSQLVLILRRHVSDSFSTYSSRGDDQLNLTPLGAHKSGELLAHTLENAQSVVLSKSLEEVLDGLALVLDANLLLEFGNNLALVGRAESGCVENLLELDVTLEDGGEVLKCLGSVFESLCFGGGSVL